MILDNFPEIHDFYQNYWGKRPFVVKGAINAQLFDQMIDGDSLAALSMEDEVRSRLIVTQQSDDETTWQCEHGPFEENRFFDLGEEGWSLLVQNVEQYHPPTAQLLNQFGFAPRWLMDDIMISYSATGGSVGPHTDSYHVFLAQGIGKRRWRVGHEKLQNQDLADNDEHLVLKHGFEGEAYDVEMGDVIYIPPHFAHEGITLDDAMTFSVGFLGPKLSELFVEYGQYLEQQEDRFNKRYIGQGLTDKDVSGSMSGAAKNDIVNDMIDGLSSSCFSAWLSSYFSAPTHCQSEDIDEVEEILPLDVIENAFNDDAPFYRNFYVRCVLVEGDSPELSVYGRKVELGDTDLALLKAALDMDVVCKSSVPDFKKIRSVFARLYNLGVFSLEPSFEDLDIENI